MTDADLAPQMGASGATAMNGEKDMSTTEFAVTGMTCGHCESAIRAEVSQISGVTEIQVSAATGLLAVTAELPVEETAVIAAVEEAGYEAVRS